MLGFWETFQFETPRVLPLINTIFIVTANHLWAIIRLQTIAKQLLSNSSITGLRGLEAEGRSQWFLLRNVFLSTCHRLAWCMCHHFKHDTNLVHRVDFHQVFLLKTCKTKTYPAMHVQWPFTTVPCIKVTTQASSGLSGDFWDGLTLAFKAHVCSDVFLKSTSLTQPLTK